jgi:protein-tyrosine-phosphatase
LVYLWNLRNLWILMASIAFICTANRCRSVMAHAIFAAEVARRQLPIQIYSAGVYDFSDLPPVNDTTLTCLRNNTPVVKEESTWAGNLPLALIDRFLVMEQHHADALIGEFGVAPERVSLLAEFDPQDRGREIADPIGHGSAVYEKCYRQIRDCVVSYLDSPDDAASVTSDQGP